MNKMELEKNYVPIKIKIINLMDALNKYVHTPVYDYEIH